MDTAEILAQYSSFADHKISNRFIKQDLIEKRLLDLPDGFQSRLLGNSAEDLPIHLITCGKGAIKIMLWSQMHGDEATGTMALLDLIGYIRYYANTPSIEKLLANCTLYIIPMVNPDGAAHFTRRNAQQLDINRDYLQTISPEAKILKQIRRDLQPDFGFNLHDQDTLWSVSNTGNPATLSFLAPAYNVACNSNETRTKAMLVIIDMFAAVDPLLPKQIGLFDECYEPRAFGDNFQQEGTATILIEAGGRIDDPEKQETRKYFFMALLAGLESIAQKSYQDQQPEHYNQIPSNTKTIFHILIHQLAFNGILASIGLNYLEVPNPGGTTTTKTYYVADIGDLSAWSAYHSYSASELTVVGEIRYAELANFDLFQDQHIILSFKDGILQSKQ